VKQSSKAKFSFRLESLVFHGPVAIGGEGGVVLSASSLKLEEMMLMMIVVEVHLAAAS
jgi:hypothetical protein